MKTTNTYGAELIDVMGNDLTVVNAARVSFDKQSDWEWENMVFTDPDTGDEFPTIELPKLKDADKRLISYLATHGHWSPFSHPQLSFRVSAPIFVARQLQKHVVGLAWNEVSRRYVKAEPAVYEPEAWRLKADNVKQGSSDEIAVGRLVCIPEYETGYGWENQLYTPKQAYSQLVELAGQIYGSMVANGICPEQARMVLPQAMITEWVWTGSLYAFARVCNQRLKTDAQRECRPVAEAIDKAAREHFPVSWEALRGS